jgi:hypothetical protein
MDRVTLLTVLGLLLTNAGFLFGMWKYFDARVSRVYARFDEHKKEIEKTYVRMDTCRLLHTSTADNLKGVENRMDVRFDKLEQKVESAFGMILDLLKHTNHDKRND